MRTILFAFCLLPLVSSAQTRITNVVTLTSNQVAWIDSRIAASNTVHGVTLTRQQLVEHLATNNIRAHIVADAARKKNAEARK